MATLIEVLNNEEGRKLVEQLEDVSSSLSSYPEGDATLEEMRDHLIAKLQADFDFHWK